MTATETAADVAPDPVVLAIRGLTKIYGPVRVVDGVDLDVRAGTIHALLGENGAGKSTLIKMISGAVGIDGGDVLLDGQEYRPTSVKDAQDAGLVALPQELLLAPGLDAVDNIHLGMPGTGRAGVIRRRRLEKDTRDRLAELGQSRIPLRVPVRELSPVQQTMVALARALVRRARVLVLDEPTAALTDTETDQLFAVLRRLRDGGTAIVYVSHRLEEVVALCDTATVLRNGRLVWTKPVAETSVGEIVPAMIGRSPEQVYPERAVAQGAPSLVVEGLSGRRLKDVTFTAHRGRVLGIAGLAGAGRSELLRLLAGAQRPTAGRILLDGVDLPLGSVGRALAAGVALVPEERRTQGLVLNDTIKGNIALANLGAVARHGIVQRRPERAMAERQVGSLQVKARSVDQPVVELSGGNQQKVVLAKVLQRNPRVLLLDEPTRGIDIGTKAEIYALVRRLADDGVTVLVVSSEIPELIGLADDVLVLHEGRVVTAVRAADTDETTVLHHCYGEKP